ncbi:MAG: hypothetical protein FJX31_11420 [Alphaproteobacteria bacterium]|nr:hypothetical protein [Alphaproteobacteria bacterium]
MTEQAELRDHRIGIDTGAYESGVLTARCLEGTERRLLQTEERDSSSSCATSPPTGQKTFSI